MAFWSNISTISFLVALILLILCIISFFKKNGKAMKYGRPAVLCFMISFLIHATTTTETKHPIVNFFAYVCFILFVFFLVLAILSIIKKTGMAKKQFLITGGLLITFVVLANIATPSTEKVTAKDKKIAAEKTDKKDAEKEEEQQTKKEKEEQKQQAEAQAKKQQEEQQRQAAEQAQKQQEEQKRQAEEQARKQQEDQKRQAEEQTKKQQEQQAASQAQPAAENNSNVQYKNCTEVKNAGKAPLYSGQPGYSRKLDRDGDGVACER
ncbi:excalibur calcium-binding domain-containing protein [Bacillus mycoides]|uniref:excalibur calcium-binding domain-containing protein n=1 Tax=Bacillus mycoides TaxID=1405 RepID=UPI003CC7F4C7